MMDRLSTALKSYLTKAKDQLAQAKQSFFDEPTPSVEDNTPSQTDRGIKLNTPNMQSTKYKDSKMETLGAATTYSPEFDLDIEITEEEQPGKAITDTRGNEGDTSIDGSEYKNTLDSSVDIDQHSIFNAEDLAITPELSLQKPPPLDSFPAQGPPGISLYTRMLDLKEEYALYGALAHDPFSARRGNIADTRPIIRHSLCCDNCHRTGHRWMYCPEACRECGSFHAGYLICGSRDRKRKGDEVLMREDCEKRGRLGGYMEERVLEKVREEWIPLLVQSGEGRN